MRTFFLELVLWAVIVGAILVASAFVQRNEPGPLDRQAIHEYEGSK